ncbi:MAG: FtsL-like putative cell division protein [bacterium]
MWWKKKKSTEGNSQPKKTSKFSKRLNQTGSFFKNLAAGDILVSDMLQRQLPYIILVFVLSLLYINNRFLYERQLRKLNDSKIELIDLKYRSLTISKELMLKGRRTEVIEQLQRQGSDLQEATSPIIIIKE